MIKTAATLLCALHSAAGLAEPPEQLPAEVSAAMDAYAKCVDEYIRPRLSPDWDVVPAGDLVDAAKSVCDRHHGELERAFKGHLGLDDAIEVANETVELIRRQTIELILEVRHAKP